MVTTLKPIGPSLMIGASAYFNLCLSYSRVSTTHQSLAEYPSVSKPHVSLIKHLQYWKVTTSHFLLQMSTRMGQATEQWDDQYFTT